MFKLVLKFVKYILLGEVGSVIPVSISPSKTVQHQSQNVIIVVLFYNIVGKYVVAWRPTRLTTSLGV